MTNTVSYVKLTDLSVTNTDAHETDTDHALKLINISNIVEHHELDTIFEPSNFNARI